MLVLMADSRSKIMNFLSGWENIQQADTHVLSDFYIVC